MDVSRGSLACQMMEGEGDIRYHHPVLLALGPGTSNPTKRDHAPRSSVIFSEPPFFLSFAERDVTCVYPHRSQGVSGAPVTRGGGGMEGLEALDLQGGRSGPLSPSLAG